MQVFKLCLKILKKNVPLMLVYISIFLVITIIMTYTAVNERQKENLFTQEKTNIAFISEENTPLINGLKQELGKVASFVGLPDKTDALQEALYFRVVTYILRIPRGFTDSFMKGEDAQVEKTVVPNSYSNAYIDLTIDKYLNIARLYVKQMRGISQEFLAERLKIDLSGGPSVELKTLASDSGNNIYLNQYFNFFPYALLYVLILGMAELMLVFNDSDLRKRNACSPLSVKNMNMQFILANVMFTFVSWLIMVACCLVLNLKNIFNLSTVYFITNSFVFAVCGASMSFLIGNLVKSRGAISAVSNVVSLGLSFISGVFVPQEFLGSFVLKIASFTPTYWFVKANNRIAELTQFDFVHLKDVLSEMLVQACFALAFFTVAMVIAKKKRLT